LVFMFYFVWLAFIVCYSWLLLQNAAMLNYECNFVNYFPFK